MLLRVLATPVLKDEVPPTTGKRWSNLATLHIVLKKETH